MQTKFNYSLLVILLLIFFVGCDQGHSIDEMRITIKNYIKSIYQKNYKSFDQHSYSKSSELKKNSFKSLTLASDLNVLLKKKYGRGSTIQFFLYSGGYLSISYFPDNFDYDAISKLKLTSIKGQQVIVEPQSKTYFQFIEKDGLLRVNLDAGVVDMDVYSKNVAEVVNRLENVHDKLLMVDSSKVSLEKFASQFTPPENDSKSPFNMKLQSHQ